MFHHVAAENSLFIHSVWHVSHQCALLKRDQLNLLLNLLSLWLVFMLTTINTVLEVYLLYEPDNQKDNNKHHRLRVAIYVRTERNREMTWFPKPISSWRHVRKYSNFFGTRLEYILLKPCLSRKLPYTFYTFLGRIDSTSADWRLDFAVDINTTWCPERKSTSFNQPPHGYRVLRVLQSIFLFGSYQQRCT